MNCKKLFIWDFHGTLEKGNDLAVLEITNMALEQRGFTRRMSLEEAERLSGRRWHEYFAYLIPESEPEEQIGLQTICLSIQQKNPDIVAKHIQLNTHAHEVLQAICKSPHSQILLSNTQPSALDFFLKQVDIDHFFSPSHRFAMDTHVQARRNKKSWLIEYLSQHPFEQGIVSIGDSPGDVELAECHSKGMGYLYIYPGRQHRQAMTPHRKIHHLHEVLVEL